MKVDALTHERSVDSFDGAIDFWLSADVGRNSSVKSGLRARAWRGQKSSMVSHWTKEMIFRIEGKRGAERRPQSQSVPQIIERPGRVIHLCLN